MGLGVLGCVVVGVAMSLVGAFVAYGGFGFDDRSECEQSDLALVRVAGAGDAGAVRDELATGGPDQVDANENTALGCALYHHRSEVASILLDAGADPNRPSGAAEFVDMPIELARRPLVSR